MTYIQDRFDKDQHDHEDMDYCEDCDVYYDKFDGHNCEEYQDKLKEDEDE